MSFTIHTGDVLDVLRMLPDESVQCVVTSPPYWGLRDYGVEGMIGLEPTMDEHLEKIVEVFVEVRRILRDDGTLWMNYGDSYAGSPARIGYGDQQKQGAYWKDSGGVDPGNGKRLPVKRGLSAKQRFLMPARVAIALQDDGWWVRSEIVWAKGVSFCPTYSGSCMPSSVRDRPTDSHEMLYLLTKRARYFYDADAVREEGVCPAGTRAAKGSSARKAEAGVNARPTEYAVYSGTRNLRTVWTINPKGYKEAHFATFPEALVKPCILAGTSVRGACAECGAPWRRVVESKVGTTDWKPTCEHADAPTRPCVVLDPFNGSGTTGAVAVRCGRDYVGIELNPNYVQMASTRIGRAAADVGQGGTITADQDERAAQLGLFE